MNALLGDLLMGARLVRTLPTYLRSPLTLEEARAVVRRRLASRETDFLVVVRDAVFGHPPSPYRALMRLAGSEYGDIERLVRQDGVEATLRILLRAGVYLTVDELRGRRPAVRGSATVETGPGRLRNPLAMGHFWGVTSGSRGSATRIPLDIRSLRDRAVNL